MNFGKKESQQSQGAATKAVSRTSGDLEIVTAHTNTRECTGECVIECNGHLRPSLMAYLSSQVLCREQSEDVIQEEFLRLVQHRVKRG